MKKSARELGKELYLNGQEMNQLLKDQGYLQGEPGAYQVTEKGLPFVSETDYHRGPGGSPQYNRDWTVRTWDESIMDQLDTSRKSTQSAIDKVAERRAAAANKASQEDEERNFVVPGPAYVSPDDDESLNTSNLGTGISGKELAIGAGIVGAAIGIGYGIYKAAPRIKRWWDEKVKPKLFK